MSALIKSRWRNTLYWIGILAGGGIFVYQAIRGTSSLLSNSVSIHNPWHLAQGLLWMVGAYSIQIYAWKVLMGGSGFHLTYRQVLAGYSLSFLPRYIPGSVWGYLSRAEWMKREHGLAVHVTHLSSIIEVLLGVLSSSSVTAIYLSLAVVDGWLRLALLLGVVSGWLLTWRLLGWLFGTKALKKLVHLDDGTTWVGQLSLWRWLCLAALHLIAWGCYGVGTSLVLGSLSLAAPLGVAVFIYTTAWLVGFLVLFVPTGIGLREQMMSFLLGQLCGLTVGPAGLVAVLVRLLVSLAELCLIGLGWAVRKWNRPVVLK